MYYEFYYLVIMVPVSDLIYLAWIDTQQLEPWQEPKNTIFLAVRARKGTFVYNSFLL